FFPFCFFFSSRRRHTRSKRDWSSDVCSSDLFSTISLPSEISFANDLHVIIPLPSYNSNIIIPFPDLVSLASELTILPSKVTLPRSEERRVGKECKSRGAPYQ